jgi:isoquinoline 1-oxidoreductase subunit beta
MNTRYIVKTSVPEATSRRDFLKVGAALTLAIYLPGCSPGDDPGATATATNTPPFEPNAFVRIGADGSVTVISKHLEMGQGTYTGLATLVADELDAAWTQVSVEGAPADATRYANLAMGMQGTGGSTAIANSFEQYRQAGAAARAMLVSAAANRWNVGPAEITVAAGVVSHAASNRKASFGELVADAAMLPVPTEIRLKDPKDFVFIGKATTARVDARAKSTGAARYTQDVQLPGMLTAVIMHPPRFGSKVKSFDATKATAVKGVVNVVKFETPVSTGVAVLANDFWSAKKGRDALTVEWDETNAFKQGSAGILADYRKLAATPGVVARNDGDVEAAFKKAARVIEATYEVPFLAHASMEPLNCVVQLGDNSCEMWNGEQFQSLDQPAVARVLGIPPENVKLNMLYAGGSFGRRACPVSDYVMEAAAIAKAAGTRAPVKMVWTREEDTKGGFYRPAYVHALKAGLDAQGNIIAWQQRVVGQSVMGGGPMAGMVQNGIDPTSVEGAANLPYAIPNVRVELHTTQIGVPIQWWRSVGSSHSGYVTECFLDELARAARKDPYELRRSLLGNHPRHLAALELAAERAGWGTPLPTGRARGIAVHESFGTVVAQVAEVTKTGQSYKLDRVVCSVECGIAVNPDIIAMQMESGIGYGLSAALNGAITLKDGVVEQSNFHEYPVLRINQMPAVEVYIVPSDAKPSGVGEPGTPVIAPALVNALMVLTGKPVHALPLSTQGIQMA